MMDIDRYQRATRETVQNPSHGDEKIVALLGLAGEAGELISEYKKHLRDGEAHRLFPVRVREELGDLLWYIARTADLFGIPLSEVAEENLLKTKGRWGKPEDQPALLAARPFDENFPEAERIPRRMRVELREVEHGERRVIHTFVDGVRAGDHLTDNSYVSDGYRFHDVFHFSYAAVLGWGPIVRVILQRKRRSDLEVDEVQDGGRAKVIDEGVSALVFAYAREHNWLEGVQSVDRDLLRTIQKMTSHLEVAACTTREWESAILQGYEVWRAINRQIGGAFIVDLDERTISLDQ